MNTNHTEPNALRQARKAAGLTRAELADKVGVSQVTISRWENGGPILAKYRSALEQALPELKQITNSDNFEFRLDRTRTPIERRNSALAQARVSAGLTQDQLAKALNIYRTTVSVWESNQHPVPTEYRVRLEQLLGDVSGITFTEPRRNSAFAQARITAGLTRPQLAKAVGVSAMTINRWENGEFRPMHKYRAKLEEVLGIELEEALGIDREKVLGDLNGIAFAGSKSALTQARLNAGLTIAKLADAVGVSLGTIHDWETGKRQIKPKYHAKLEEVLGIKLATETENEQVKVMNYEIINEKKRELGLTNLEIAKKAGLTPDTVNKIATGAHQNPTFNTLLAIAKAIGCRLDDFVDRTETEPDLPSDALEIAKSYSELDTYGKRNVSLAVKAESERCQEERKWEEYEQRENKRTNSLISMAR